VRVEHRFKGVAHQVRQRALFGPHVLGVVGVYGDHRLNVARVDVQLLGKLGDGPGHAVSVEKTRE